MSSPPAPDRSRRIPRLFLDRSVGRIQVARGLRAIGLDVITLAELYGIPADETIADVTWLNDVGAQGWVVIMRDKKILSRPAERAALRDAQVHAFLLSASISADEMLIRLANNLDHMVERCATDPEPRAYRVHPGRLQHLRLD